MTSWASCRRPSTRCSFVNNQGAPRLNHIPSNPYRRLEASLRRLRRRWLLVEAAASAFVAGAVALGFGLVWLTAEALVYTPSWMRLMAGPLAVGSALVAGLLWLRRRLGRWPDLHRVALLAEERCPSLAQRLIAAWELHPVRERRHLSASLLEAAATEAADLLEAAAPASLLPARPIVRPLAGLAGVAGVLILSLAAAGDHLLPALDRSLNPTVSYERPRRTRPGRATGTRLRERSPSPGRPSICSPRRSSACRTVSRPRRPDRCGRPTRAGPRTRGSSGRPPSRSRPDTHAWTVRRSPLPR